MWDKARIFDEQTIGTRNYHALSGSWESTPDSAMTHLWHVVAAQTTVKKWRLHTGATA
jgi:hypothetical protein